MSRRKKQSPAAIAESIAKYIAKQEETLKKYPVGPMANSARMNLRKGQAALQALQGKNEQMKQQMEGQVKQTQGQVPQFTEGGDTNETTPATNSPIRQALVDANNADQLAMFDVFKGDGFDYSDDAALAITSITEKESGGNATAVEGWDYQKTGTWGKNDKNNPNFTKEGETYKDYARLRGFHKNASSMKTEDIDKIYTGTDEEKAEKFFNAMYGEGDKADQLGNDQPGDGAKFRGRGMFQLTGRANYQALSDWAYENKLVDEPNYYVNNPDQVATQDAVANVTGYYYTQNKFGDGLYGVDLTKDLSDAEIAAVMDNAYAITAGASQTGNYNFASNRSLYDGAMKTMRDWNNEIRKDAVGVDEVDYSYWTDSLPDQMSGTGKYDINTEGQIILDYLAERHPGLGYDNKDFTPKDLTAEDYKRFQRDVGITGKSVDGDVGSRTRSAYHLNRAKALESAKTELDSKAAARDIANELEQAQREVKPDQDATRVETGEQQRAQVLADPLGEVPEEPYVHRQTLPELVVEASRPEAAPMQEGQPMNRFYPGQDLGPPPPKKPYVHRQTLPEVVITPQDPRVSSGASPILQIPGSPSEAIRLQGTAPIDKLGPGLVPNELPQQRLRTPLVNAPTEPVMPSTPPTRREQREARRDQRQDDRAAARMQPMPTPIVPSNAAGNIPAPFMSPELMASAFRQGLFPEVPMFYDGGYTAEDLSWADRSWDLDNTNMDDLLLDTEGRPALVRDGRTGRIIHLTKAMYFDVNSGGSIQNVVDEALGREGSMVDSGNINMNKSKYPNIEVTDLYMQDVGSGTFTNDPGNSSNVSNAPQTATARQANQPVARRTMANTGFEPTRVNMRTGQDLYDVHGNLQGRYVGAGKISSPGGSGGRNIYDRDIAEREAFYDKDGNLIGTYAGGGVFSGANSRNPGVMAGQSLERFVQGAQAGRRNSVGTEPNNASTANMAGSTTAREEEANNISAALANASGSETNTAATTPLRDLPAGVPDTYNLDMGNASLLSAIPAAASLASVPIMRDAVNRMQAPSAPVTVNTPQFNYRSNIGQQLQDARSGVNALSRNTNLSSGQQAANRQGLLAERFRQENRLYNLDSAEYARQKNMYDRTAQQARMFNSQLRNKYAQDMQAFNNQMNLYDAQIKMQPLNVLSSSAQDYLKNIYGPSQQVALAGLGRNFDTGLLDDQS
jgi:hypothetical protein